MAPTTAVIAVLLFAVQPDAARCESWRQAAITWEAATKAEASRADRAEERERLAARERDEIRALVRRSPPPAQPSAGSEVEVILGVAATVIAAVGAGYALGRWGP